MGFRQWVATFLVTVMAENGDVIVMEGESFCLPKLLLSP